MSQATPAILPRPGSNASGETPSIAVLLAALIRSQMGSEANYIESEGVGLRILGVGRGGFAHLSRLLVAYEESKAVCLLRARGTGRCGRQSAKHAEGREEKNTHLPSHTILFPCRRRRAASDCPKAREGRGLRTRLPRVRASVADPVIHRSFPWSSHRCPTGRFRPRRYPPGRLGRREAAPRPMRARAATPPGPY